MSEIEKISREAGTAAIAAKYSVWSLMGTGPIWAVVVIVGAFYTIQDLKKGRWWAWVGGLSLLLLTAPSWSFPVSVIGIISLLDEEVRGEFLAQIDVKI
ncbi:hypothetical protein D3C87_1489760 [compost metagenome]